MRFWRKAAKSAHPGYDQVLPPEGVPLLFQIAGPGVRLAAQVTDILITLVAAVAFLILIYTLGLASPHNLTAIGSMLFFIIRIPYYVLTELLWNGQTLGKRLLKLKVISAGGGSLTAQSLVVRNLMKEAEIFLPGTLLIALDQASMTMSLISLAWIIAVLAVPLMNRRRQRLGDLIAGTFVIHLPEPILLSDLAQTPQTGSVKAENFTFLTHQLDHYGAFELQTLEDLLRAGDRPLTAPLAIKRKQTLAAVVEQIRRKIDFADAVEEADHNAFLTAFYNAQRAYLEQRQIFGEKRADKTHADP